MSGVNDLFKISMNQLTLLGQVLLDDDLHDYGWFTYYDRPGHPDHPSPFHHWQVGAFLIFVGEIMKKAIELLNMIGINIADLFLKLQNMWKPANEQEYQLGDNYTR